MAEICCDVVSPRGTPAERCEHSPRTARRRRMEIRRFRFVGGAEAMASPAEPMRKRQRVDLAVCSPQVLQRDHRAVQTRVAEHGSGAGGESGSSDTSSSANLELARPALAATGAYDAYPGYGMTSVCGRRRDMEDTVSIRPDFLLPSPQIPGKHHFFGVYDGHGCSHVAVSCKDRMHEMIAAEFLERLERGHHTPPAWKEVMERSFSRMDAEVGAWRNRPSPVSCRCEMQTLNSDHVGSTAVVAVVSREKIIVANCGDSRAVLCRKGVALPLSTDHKPDRPDELQRIQDAGGRVIYWDGARVLGVLAMSRAIGDGYLKPFVISEPEVTITERSDDDECLILASDGLWDVVTNEMACDIVRMCLRGSAPSGCRSGVETGTAGGAQGEGNMGFDQACSDAAMLLTKLALARQSADNVSVVVVDLRRRS